MLGHPALVAGFHARDAERVAFLAEQRVAAVARAVGPDLAGLGEVRDVLGLVAGPGHVGRRGRRQRIAHGVHAAHEIFALPERLPHLVADAGHDVHVGDGVGAVRHHDADAGDRRADRSHRIRQHIHGAAGHGAVIELGERCLHLGGVEPVVGRTRVVLALRADVGLVLDAGDVEGVGAHEDRVRPLLRVEPQRRAAIDQRFQHALIFVLGAVAPHDLVRLEQLPCFLDESEHLRIGGLCFLRGNLRLNAHAAESLGEAVNGAVRSPLALFARGFQGKAPKGKTPQARAARASAASRTSSFRAASGVAVRSANRIRRASPSRTRSNPSGSMPVIRQPLPEAPARDFA